MKTKPGIMIKFFLWYFALVSIFSGTIFVLFVHIQHIVKVSDNIVNKNYRVSSAAKKMIDSLLWMEENENKYDLLQKEDYKRYFIAAQKEFEENLNLILALDLDPVQSTVWDELIRDYEAAVPSSSKTLELQDASEGLWIEEDVINEWISRISKARSDNEHEIEVQMFRVTTQGRMAVRYGMIGLGGAILVCLLGTLYLTHSMNRPLRELRKGIGSISHKGMSDPIPILTKDELGQLAGAFNDMAARLKEEERLRSDFISMLSHEIRTPLTSVRESVNLMVEEVVGPINERQRRFLEISSAEIARISDLLSRLMQISRLEAGLLKITKEPIDPNAFVNGTVRRMIPAAEAKNIVLETELPTVSPPIMGDFAHLQQVLMNLLGNAVKFSPPDSKVVVRVEPDRSDGELGLRFSVTDLGPGVPEEELGLVFHKYYRASDVRDQVDGVGLGLSISKHIIEAHGGTLWVQSLLGQGSTFGFTLPVSREEEHVH